MERYKTYADAERDLILDIIYTPDFKTKTTFERIGVGFIITDPYNNVNLRSNYEYAEAFFQWILTGNTDLSDEILKLNPWTNRFVTNTGLPESFSATYGKKIKEQLPKILDELTTRKETRRAYINILIPDDQIILPVKTTHEFPCTIGIQLFIRDHRLIMMVNMRSNNVYSVMPYDVYNFTRLQQHIGELINYPVGSYYHQINNAHIYNGDVRRLIETDF